MKDTRTDRVRMELSGRERLPRKALGRSALGGRRCANTMLSQAKRMGPRVRGTTSCLPGGWDRVCEVKKQRFADGSRHPPTERTVGLSTIQRTWDMASCTTYTNTLLQTFWVLGTPHTRTKTHTHTHTHAHTQRTHNFRRSAPGE